METLWMNGEYMPLAAGRISIEDRSVLFSDGIYEVIEGRHGVPIFLEEHLDRWEQSAVGLRLASPYDRMTRVQVIGELLCRTPAERVLLYGQLTRGAARRAHPFPANPQPTEFWFAREMAPKNPRNYVEGVAAITHPDERWTRRWIKSTSLLANILAKQAAVEAGAYDAIMYTEDGYVTEASTATVFAVRGGRLYTHPLNGRILAGCTRRALLNIAREHAVTLIEERFPLEFLRNADEAFFTSTTIGVLPIVIIDGHPVGGGKVGPATKRMIGLMEQEYHKITSRAREEKEGLKTQVHPPEFVK